MFHPKGKEKLKGIRLYSQQVQSMKSIYEVIIIIIISNAFCFMVWLCHLRRACMPYAEERIWCKKRQFLYVLFVSRRTFMIINCAFSLQVLSLQSANSFKRRNHISEINHYQLLICKPVHPHHWKMKSRKVPFSPKRGFQRFLTMGASFKSCHFRQLRLFGRPMIPQK